MKNLKEDVLKGQVNELFDLIWELDNGRRFYDPEEIEDMERRKNKLMDKIAEWSEQ